MTQIARAAVPYETGGVLMGYEAAAGDIVVTVVIGPGPSAIHSHDHFIPDHSFQQAEINDVYSRSGRLETYLGDWHTHPSGSICLSRQDRETLLSIALSPSARIAAPVMAILAGSTTDHLAVWRLRHGRLVWRPRLLHTRIW